MVTRKLLYTRDDSSPLALDSLPLVSSHHRNEAEAFDIDEENCIGRYGTGSHTSVETITKVTAFEKVGSSDDSRDAASIAPETAPHKSLGWLWGRLLLFVLGVVYGSLNVSMRMVFARPNPPTPSASSTIQGWFSVLGFLPLLWWKNARNAKNQNHRAGTLPKQRHCQTCRTILFGSSDSNIFYDPINGANDQELDRSKQRQTQNQYQARLVWFALELALWNFGTQALINTSLLVTRGARASFLVSTSVVWTPIVSSVMTLACRDHKNTTHPPQSQRGRRAIVWGACVLALLGAWVISQGENGSGDEPVALAAERNDASAARVNGNSSLSLSPLSPAWGDLCCLLAALCWSLYICRLSALGDSFDETTTQFVKNVFLAILYSIWMVASVWYHNASEDTADDSSSFDAHFSSWSLWKDWKTDSVAWGILIYTALGPCTIADVCQQTAQASVPAAETNVILSMEPVFTTLLGLLILGETPSQPELVGGALILVASLLAAGCGPQPPS